MNPNGRNKRSVWTVNPQGFKGAHFACFPPALVEPMVKAGSSEKGCCSACGAPWMRPPKGHSDWQPSCECVDVDVVPCRVLDPFSGSATTGQVALKLGREYLGTDISAEYLAVAEARLMGTPPPTKDPEPEGSDAFDLFGDRCLQP